MSDSGPDSLTERERLLWGLLTSVGICAQLLGTRATEALGEDLPPPQFTMLNHFVGVPPPVKTVGQMAQAFQAPQPGITKTAQKLIAKGSLRRRTIRRMAAANCCRSRMRAGRHTWRRWSGCARTPT